MKKNNRIIIIEYKISFNDGISKSKINSNLVLIRNYIKDCVISDEIDFKFIILPTLDGNRTIESKILFDSDNSYETDSYAEILLKVDEIIKKSNDLFEKEINTTIDQLDFLKDTINNEIDHFHFSFWNFFNIKKLKNKLINRVQTIYTGKKI